jgi:hypothetical protein
MDKGTIWKEYMKVKKTIPFLNNSTESGDFALYQLTLFADSFVELQFAINGSLFMLEDIALVSAKALRTG